MSSAVKPFIKLRLHVGIFTCTGNLTQLSDVAGIVKP